LVVNSERFQHDEYQDEPIVSQSLLTFRKITKTPMRRDYAIQMTTVEREDNIFMTIPGFT